MKSVLQQADLTSPIEILSENSTGENHRRPEKTEYSSRYELVTRNDSKEEANRARRILAVLLGRMMTGRNNEQNRKDI